MAFEPENDVGGLEESCFDVGRVRRGGSANHQTFKSVLLALTDVDQPNAALQHAFALSHALDADLHVLRVLPRERQFASFVADFDIVHATRRVQRCLAAARGVKAWCDDLLPEPLGARRLRIRIGDFVAEASRYAAELEGALIVLAPSTGRLAATATALARYALRPVLVARPSRGQETLLAATDLEDDDVWLLRRVVALGAQLGTPVVAMHNVSCLSAPIGHDSPTLAAASPIPCAGDPRESRLQRAARRMAPLSTVLTREIDPVDAILEQALVQRAHTIVVGVRPRSWFERFIAPSVTAEVLNRADRSVLVVPRPAADSLDQGIRL